MDFSLIIIYTGGFSCVLCVPCVLCVLRVRCVRCVLVSLCAGSLGRWTASPHSLIVSYLLIFIVHLILHYMLCSISGLHVF